MEFFPKTAQGLARLATEEEIAREAYEWIILTDGGYDLVTDNDEQLIPNVELGFTNMDLHRRIDQAPSSTVFIKPDYPFVHYRNDIRYLADLKTQDQFGSGPASKYVLTENEKKIRVPVRDHDEPFNQTIEIAVWGDDSYRTTTTYTHDEESEDEEIP